VGFVSIPEYGSPNRLALPVTDSILFTEERYFMRHSFNKLAKLVFITAMLVVASVTYPMAQGQEQSDKETEVTFIKQVDKKGRYGNRESNLIIDEQAFNELLKNENNAFLKEFEVDFSRHTLIAITVQGDCFVRATVTLARDDDKKRYLCRVTKRYGGCRAAGTFQSWILIEKIPPEYTIEFVEMKALDERQD
jgi:hypothetical protein